MLLLERKVVADVPHDDEIGSLVWYRTMVKLGTTLASTARR
jgi:hypothetical protein